jgi:uncharacterized protein (DUF983 family)
MKRLTSILSLKCPSCRSGNLFRNTPYSFKGFLKINPKCPHCRIDFNKEPSFFYGSMYVSYGLGVGLSIAIFIVMHLFGMTQSPLNIFLLIVFFITILSPYIYQLSKVIWASFFFPFKGISDTKKNTREE